MSLHVLERKGNTVSVGEGPSERLSRANSIHLLNVTSVALPEQRQRRTRSAERVVYQLRTGARPNRGKKVGDMETPALVFDYSS